MELEDFLVSDGTSPLPPVPTMQSEDRSRLDEEDVED